MNEIVFAAMCAALYAQYEPLIKIFSGVIAGTGILAGVTISLIKAFRNMVPVTQ